MDLKNLISTGEASGFTRTGRHAETIRLSRAFEQAFPGRVRVQDLGMTPEGEPILALVVTASGAFSPEEARQRNLPVLFFQAGIHPGEIEGKDAGFWFLRELLTEKIHPGALGRLVIVFVPTLNVDGHERFSAYNRPNQNGPEEMGWRTTAQNYNLNRDYTKIDSPEMAAVLRLQTAWDPEVFVDVHATDGAKFEHDLSILIDQADVGDEPLRAEARQVRTELFERLAKHGHTTVEFYPNLRDGDDPASGFVMDVLGPRYSNGYWGARSRISVLVETHSWRDYNYRVHTVLHIFDAFVAMALEHGHAWRKAIKGVDDAHAKLAGRDVTLSWKNSERYKTIDFKGYEYRHEASEISGKRRVIYDDTKKQIWKVPYWEELVPDVTVRAPKVGYVIPRAYAALLAEKLRLHGLDFTVVPRSGEAEVQTFRADHWQFASEPFESHHRVTVKGAWRPERRKITEGSLFVPIAQAQARMALHLFEPAGPDSFLQWGFFNGVFERKEYMEHYVTEDVAREMLEDPRIRDEFEKRLATDAAFAQSPDARLDFFYRKHPSWDERLGLYPVYRLEAALPF